jgi:hypothetical protein
MTTEHLVPAEDGIAIDDTKARAIVVQAIDRYVAPRHARVRASSTAISA